MQEIKIYEDATAVAEAFAQQLFELATAKAEPIHVALSGGSTPALLFDVLARDYATKLPWRKLHFWWGDERCVPPTDEQSNYKMTVDHLFSKIDMPAANIHRVQGELSPETANERYMSEISKSVPMADGWPLFDLIILGMGTDGHTASIFPHEMELLEAETICAIATHPESGQKRVSLTGKAINQALEICFLVTGASKAERIGEIIQGLPGYEALPSSHIQTQSGKLSWYLDQAAATELDS